MEKCFLSNETTLNKHGENSFTSREIDIISCIINGGTAKSISRLLGISPYTVNTHIKNIKSGMKCFSQEQIIKVVEASDNYRHIRERYIDLLIFNKFQEMLKKIEKLEISQKYKCVIHTDTKSIDKYILLHYFKLAGIKIDIAYDSIDYASDKFHITCFSENTNINLENLNADNIVISKNHHNNVINLIGQCIDSEESESQYNCYSSLLGCIRKIYSSNNIDSIINEFKEYYFNIKRGGITSTNLEHHYVKNYIEITDKKKTKYTLTAFIACAICLLAVYINKTSLTPISNLHIVMNESLIKRYNLLSKIDAIFNKQNHIKHVILVGQGGVGKTTLARDYMSNSSSKTKYEINAKTEASTVDSFSDLAIELAKKEKDLREELSYIQAIQEKETKTKKIISFVFSQLKERNDWILFFDNIDDFKMIQKFLPANEKLCGSGKIIITTKDINCENVNFLSQESILHIDYLEEHEKNELFYKIYGEKTKLSNEKKEEINKFIQNIPPMPLDISVAAYYIKSTGTSFEEYLKIIESPKEITDQMQSKFLEEGTGGNYSKTRYKIMSTAFNKLIEINPHFKELLLMICLLDSQNISRQYLDKCKDPLIVSDFLYNLKKFSLIKFNKDIISIRRPTQKLGLQCIWNTLTQHEQEKFMDNIIQIMTSPAETYGFSTLSSAATLLGIHLKCILNRLEKIKNIKNKEQYITKILLALFSIYEVDFSELKTEIKEIMRLNNTKHYVTDHDILISCLEAS